MAENPYQYDSPISDAARFAGRQEAFAFVQTHLASGERQALVIMGPQQIGKSSLLRQVPAHLDARFYPVRLSLRAGSVAGEQAWLTALAETIPGALAALDIQSARLPVLPGQPAELREALTGEYMAEGLRALRRDRHLLIMVDNAERLLTAVQARDLPRDSFAFLGRLLEAHPRLHLLMAVDSQHESALLSTGAPFAPRLVYRLGPLAREEVDALLTRPLADTVAYEPAALDALYELTAGHPYLAQLMGWLLYERSEARGHALPIGAEDVEAVIEPALGLAGDMLGQVWSHGSPQERLVLAALSALSPEEPPTPVHHEDISAWLMAADRPLDPRTVNATWRRLEYEGVLQLSADGRLVVRGGLQRRWLRAHVTLPEEAGGLQLASRRRVGVIAVVALLVALAALLAALSVLPGREAPESGEQATITFVLDLQATQDSYSATQTAAAP